MMKVSYDNIYNMVFHLAIFSMIIVVLINNLKKVNVRISFIKKGIKDKKSILIYKKKYINRKKRLAKDINI